MPLIALPVRMFPKDASTILEVFFSCEVFPLGIILSTNNFVSNSCNLAYPLKPLPSPTEELRYIQKSRISTHLLPLNRLTSWSGQTIQPLFFHLSRTFLTSPDGHVTTHFFGKFIYDVQCFFLVIQVISPCRTKFHQQQPNDGNQDCSNS